MNPKHPESQPLPMSRPEVIRVLLFDYGGVVAEEGFREGLKASARRAGLEPDSFFELAARAVYDSGYLVGRAHEADYWNLVRARSGITYPDEELRKEIFERFTLRQWVLDLILDLRARGYWVAMLSDQTDWLDQLDRRDDFFQYFDDVFNSYHLGKGKQDPTVFADVARRLEVAPSAMLFIDDNPGNVERAQSQGLRTILYRDPDSLLQDLKGYGVLE
ncbi:MAG: HAD family phosphatase [Desulfomonile tiedjei]|nr:HAD family phosphatase [Desulfomonile tiedjei]